jgi:hypothetical protein
VILFAALPELNLGHLVAGGSGALLALLAALPRIIRKGGKVVDAIRAAQDSEILRKLTFVEKLVSQQEQASAARVGGLGQISAMLTQCTAMQVELAARLGAVEEANRKVLDGVNGWGGKLEQVNRKVDALGERVGTLEVKLA